MLGDRAGLLALEIDVIHKLAPSPRAVVRCLDGLDVLLAFGWSPGAGVLVADSSVCGLVGSDELRRLLRERERFEPRREPTLVTDLAHRIAEVRPAPGPSISGGPSYLFPDDLPHPPPSSLPVIICDPAGQERASRLDRPANWEAGEWADLISGQIGAWAMAIDGNSPVSICHSPAANAEAAEAGTWTREDHRGRGLAPVTTRAWFEQERLHKKALFYSTASTNYASQAVARKLGLEPLGWLWTIR